MPFGMYNTLKPFYNATSNLWEFHGKGFYLGRTWRFADVDKAMEFYNKFFAPITYGEVK